MGNLGILNILQKARTSKPQLLLAFEPSAGFLFRHRGSQVRSHLPTGSRMDCKFTFWISWKPSYLSFEEKLCLQKYADESVEVPRPKHWGGFLVRPSLIEFWQGKPSRLHDRLQYTRSTEEDSWKMERIAPWRIPSYFSESRCLDSRSLAIIYSVMRLHTHVKISAQEYENLMCLLSLGFQLSELNSNI